MANGTLNFGKGGVKVPGEAINKALLMVNKLVEDDRTDERKSQLLSTNTVNNMVDNDFKKQKLALEKQKAAEAKANARKALLAQTAGNDALMKAMLPSMGTENVISEADATKAMLASPKILQRAAKMEDNPTLAPFMSGGSTPPVADTSGQGLLADMMRTQPEVAMKDVAPMTMEEAMAISNGQGQLPMVGGQPRNGIFKAPTAPQVTEVAPTPEVQRTPLISSIADENRNVNEGVADIMEAGADNRWVKEAGVPVTQQEVMKAATTKSMIDSLVQSYHKAKTPRGKNAIASKIATLQATEAKLSSDNKKYTHDMNKILFKSKVDPENLPETTTTSKANQGLINDTLDAIGVPERDMTGAVSNALLTNHGTFDRTNINKYVAKARLGGATDAQIAAALQNLKGGNFIIDDELTQSADQFLETALRMPKTSVKTKN